MRRGKLKKESGVYSIKCVQTGKQYIGSSKNIYRRYLEHRAALIKGTHGNRFLQFAWDKYGENSFIYSALLYCHEDIRFEKEQEFIDKYNVCNPDCGYNLDPIASPTFQTEQSKLNISKAKKGRKQSEEHRQKNREVHTGLKLSETAKQKLRDFHKGKPKSKEHCINISKGKLGKSNWKVKGIPVPEERKEKIRKSLIKYYAERRLQKAV